MPTSSSVDPDRAASHYWHLRDGELRKLVIATTDAVGVLQRAQAVVAQQWPTARVGEESWETAVTTARAAVRAARTKRTQLRRMVNTLKDTLRIRKNLEAACPDKMREAIEVAERMCDYMDAHGF